MDKKGYFSHECPHWDFLEIDETCYEIATCDCFNEDALNLIKIGYRKLLSKIANEEK